MVNASEDKSSCFTGCYTNSQLTGRILVSHTLILQVRLDKPVTYLTTTCHCKQGWMNLAMQNYIIIIVRYNNESTVKLNNNVLEL